MKRENFDTAFTNICEVIQTKQSAALVNFTKGNTKLFDKKFVNYVTFVTSQVEEQIEGDYPNTLIMNSNLNYILNRWDF